MLAALRYRNRTGKGQFIDLAQYESTISLLGTSFLQYTVNGVLPARPGNRSDYAAPHGAYQCAGDNRWCAIAVFTDDDWHGLRRAMGGPAGMAESRFQTLAGRKKHEDELDLLVEEWTRELSAHDVMTRLQDHGVPAGVVQNTRDLLENDVGYRERHVRLLDHPEVGTMTIHGEPISLSGMEPRFQRAPLLGEHTEYVLKDLLGVEEPEINRLYVDGVLQ